MAITGLVATLIINVTTTLDATIETWVQSLTIAHVYGFSVIPLSNTQARLILVYD